MKENDDGGFDLDELIGATFDTLTFAVQAVLIFSAGPEHTRVATLSISEAFTVFDGTEQHTAYFGPINDGPPFGLDVVARLAQERATECVVTRGAALASGALVVEFSNGWRIEVPCGSEYEGWTFSSIDGLLVAPPGGGL